MTEEKKPKIDLKSRLGKKTVSVQGGPTVPPPVGLPRPPAGIPAPPFAAPSRPSAPRVDVSDPYASIAAADAPRVEPQAIKIEMSEEVVAAQKKGRTRVIALAAVTALVGAVLGYAVGGRAEAGKQQTAALEGAKILKGEVAKANETAAALADTLKSAIGQIKNNKYPEAEVAKLGELNIPFEGGTLASKGLGRFNAKLATMLVRYSSVVQEANDQKDSVQRLMGAAKKPILDYLDDKEKPKVRWSVYVTGGPFGPWASMQPLPAPFLVKSDEKTKDKDGKEVAYKWPSEFKIPQGGKDFDLKRYESGDPTGNPPKIIPVDPSTSESVCPSDVLGRLARELSSLETALRGDNTPGEEKDGAIQLGEQVAEELARILGPGS